MFNKERETTVSGGRGVMALTEDTFVTLNTFIKSQEEELVTQSQYAGVLFDISLRI